MTYHITGQLQTIIAQWHEFEFSYEGDKEPRELDKEDIVGMAAIAAGVHPDLVNEVLWQDHTFEAPK